MYLAIKNLFQLDEIWVVIAGVAKLIFDFCYLAHAGPTWLLKVDFHSQLGIRSVFMLPKQIKGLDIFERL